MRLGQNPAKFVQDVARPERITVAVLNFIPFLSGFYAEMLDVLKACLESLYANTDLPHDLLVFDNGSCPEVLEYLQGEHAEGRIQYLLLSDRNLGKGGAWNIIFSGAPGEIIAYADNDVLFYPGWLSHSIELLETYPRVGMVTARPFNTKPELYTATREWASQEPGVSMEEGRFIAWEDYRSFIMSLGTSEEQVRQTYETDRSLRLTYHGVSAIAGGSHWQFTAYKKTLSEFLPFEMTRPMGQVRQLDERMNTSGYLRLMPVQSYAQNMSNRAPSTGQAAPHKTRRESRFRNRLLDIPFVRSRLLGLYDAIFRAYYDRREQE